MKKALGNEGGEFNKKELSPKLIEEATMEIIKESMKILKDYGMKGVITDIQVGLLPVHGKKPDMNCPKKYNFNYDDLFTLLIQRGKCA